MKHLRSIRYGFVITLGLISAGAFSQGSKVKGLNGTWMLVSATVQRGETKLEPYGVNPIGTLMLDDRGRFGLMVMRADLPRFA